MQPSRTALDAFKTGLDTLSKVAELLERHQYEFEIDISFGASVGSSRVLDSLGTSVSGWATFYPATEGIHHLEIVRVYRGRRAIVPKSPYDMHLALVDLGKGRIRYKELPGSHVLVASYETDDPVHLYRREDLKNSRELWNDRLEKLRGIFGEEARDFDLRLPPRPVTLSGYVT